jgi:hypothetical protein
VATFICTCDGDLSSGIVDGSSRLGDLPSKYVIAFGGPHDEFFMASQDCCCRDTYGVDGVKETG